MLVNACKEGFCISVVCRCSYHHYSFTVQKATRSWRISSLIDMAINKYGVKCLFCVNVVSILEIENRQFLWLWSKIFSKNSLGLCVLYHNGYYTDRLTKSNSVSGWRDYLDLMLRDKHHWGNRSKERKRNSKDNKLCARTGISSFHVEEMSLYFIFQNISLSCPEEQSCIP